MAEGEESDLFHGDGEGKVGAANAPGEPSTDVSILGIGKRVTSGPGKASCLSSREALSPDGKWCADQTLGILSTVRQFSSSAGPAGIVQVNARDFIHRHDTQD